MTTNEKIETLKRNLREKNLKASLSILNNATEDDLHDLGFLTYANDVQRALKNNDQALIYAEHLLTKHPGKPVGYIRTAQELLALQRTAEAVAMIEKGLQLFPDHPNVLTAAHQVFSSKGDHQRSLVYAEKLCQLAPEKPIGFIRAAQDHYKMDRWADAIKTVRDGLSRHPENHQLLTIGIDSARQANNTEVSLQFAQSLIKVQPGNPIWHWRAAQNLLSLGQFEKSRQTIQKLEERNENNPEKFKAIRRFYRLIGDRKKSLEISTTLLQVKPTSIEAIREKISDLIALQQLEEAFFCAKNNNLCSPRASDITAQALLKHRPKPRITEEIRRTMSNLNIYPHFHNNHFNPSLETLLAAPEKTTICIVHVGKCAGESIIETLKRSFSTESTQILEYHVFDSNHLIHQAILETRNNPSIHWILLTRDPVSRWISSFNCDYHTFGSNSFFYCHPVVNDYFSKFDNCSDLITSLQQGDQDAHAFSSFHHLVFGHMAMGQAWYLSDEIVQDMDPRNTSVIRTEHIQQDFQNCLTKIMKQIPESKLIKETPVIHTKNNYQQRYKPGTFTSTKDLDSNQTCFLRDFLNSDALIHEALINNLT